MSEKRYKLGCRLHRENKISPQLTSILQAVTAATNTGVRSTHSLNDDFLRSNQACNAGIADFSRNLPVTINSVLFWKVSQTTLYYPAHHCRSRTMRLGNAKSIAYEYSISQGPATRLCLRILLHVCGGGSPANGWRTKAAREPSAASAPLAALYGLINEVSLSPEYRSRALGARFGGVHVVVRHWPGPGMVASGTWLREGLLWGVAFVLHLH